jgi:hypothetical protein
MSRRHETWESDPKKVVKAMYGVAVMKDPLLRVTAGSAAYEVIFTKIKTCGEK